MAKTEIIKVLRIIEEAKLEIMAARGEADAETSETLEDLGIRLDEIEHELIMGDLKSKVNSLGQSSAKLTSIVQEANKKSETIKKIAKIIDRVTKAIKVVTSIAVKAATII